LWLQLDDGSAQPGAGKKGCGIELGDSFRRQNATPFQFARRLASSRLEKRRCGVPQGECVEKSSTNANAVLERMSAPLSFATRRRQRSPD